MKRLGILFFWAVIAAAFIGPGTVTTAAKAGAEHGYQLLWALTFSTIACLLLQEMSSRSYLVTGKQLGERIRLEFPSVWLRGILAAAILLGGIAYEAGNLLGAASGIDIASETSGWSTTASILVIGVLATITLWNQNSQTIAKRLGFFVIVLGILILAVVAQQDHPVSDWVPALFRLSLPEGSGWLILGLIGTTIVPYNLFLGGSIGKGQSIKDMRLGLGIAILLGGVISMAILMAATGLEGEFSFEGLQDLVSRQVGSFGGVAIGAGLGIAGFTSAITAPWASALAVGTLFPEWNSPQRFRIIWALVLGSGILFGLSGIKPIPVIVMAQAFNGLALPLIGIILLIMMNRNMAAHQNGWLGNLAGLFVTGVTLILGMVQLTKLAASMGLFTLPETGELIPWYTGLALIGMGMLAWFSGMFRKR